MPRSANPKRTDSSTKPKCTRLSTSSNARTSTSSPKPPFTMTTRSKAREEARKAKLQARKAERGRQLHFEEMKFDEIKLSAKATEEGFVPRKKREKRIRQVYLRLLRRFELDFSGRGLSEELELPSASKGNRLRAAILQAASKRRKESSQHDVRPDMPTVGGLPRWDFEG